MVESVKRQHKFRAWDSDENVMRDWENLKTHTYASHKELHSIFDDDDYTIMYWTGLRDRKGVDIYESDIIKIHNLVSNILDGKRMVIIGIIYWCVKDATFYINDPINEQIYPIGSYLSNIEVMTHLYSEQGRKFFREQLEVQEYKHRRYEYDERG